jgi:Acetyltransferase (GNAT) domain
MKTTLKRIPLNSLPLNELKDFEDRHVFQSLPWLNFLQATQNSEPVIAEVRQGRESVGFFTGVLLKKWGVRILGSPFPGTNTPYMGFNLEPGIQRSDLVPALIDFAFYDLRCHHFEMSDRYLSDVDFAGEGIRYRMFEGYEVDLTPDEDQIFANMTRSCRKAIRQSKKNGVTIEEADDLEFAEEYHAQLKDVFAKSNLVPPYGVGRVRKLIEILKPSEMLLMLRARDPNGFCIATAIFLGFNDVVFAWGGASQRKYNILRPNEPLFWYAMRYWKKRGCKVLDLVGGGDYKKKFGSREIAVPWFRMSRNRAITWARHVARPLYDAGQKAVGTLRNMRLSVTGRQLEPNEE